MHVYNELFGILIIKSPDFALKIVFLVIRSNGGTSKRSKLKGGK